MKANELMIGDWVKIKTYGVSDKFEKTEAYTYVKVSEIDSGYIIVEYNNDIKEPYLCENTEIEPILLTSEILEKNGFKNGKLNVSPQYYLEDNDVFIGVTLKDLPDKHKGIDIAKGKLFFQLDVSHIEEILYVHTLQHALLLCGIKKEIVL